MDRFLDSQSREPHPALNAIYLVACYFTNSSFYSEMEPALFIQAQQEINVALDTSDRLADIVQASSLLAIYMYMNNRVMEGYRYTFSAIRLAVGLGFHQIQPPSAISPAYSHHIHPIPISPPRDIIELSDRIFAFWQVFMIDRCWSAADELPLAFPDKDTAQCLILTPWPAPLEGDTWSLFVGEFSEGTVSSYMPALKAKAAALYELTSRSNNSECARGPM
ncbi:hypothetical protein DXG03_000653 [Asterophora parasitica]|uniref:Xylanolytic transcriptional activator regulatory domain-containing protein n=1 Tax=Asterophora parasitica TaxID=117018 RepID=A0A9P7KBY2_9AGAR|nr:hypothetical protein DXG03_000653 [Asterophora parasitica]